MVSQSHKSSLPCLADAAEKTKLRKGCLKTYEPFETATKLEELFRQHGHRLRFWRDDFYNWAAIHYRQLDEQVIKNTIRQVLNRTKLKTTSDQLIGPSTSHISEVIEALKSVPGVGISRDLEAPAWLPEANPELAAKHKPHDLFALTNGLLNLGTGKLLQWSDVGSSFMTLTGRDFDYDPKAVCPRWVEFLEQILPGDTEAQETLEEMMAYTLTADRSYQKLFLLVGASRAGKGTIIHVLTALLGAANVTPATCQSIGEPHGLWPLIGKIAVIISDARLDGRNVHTMAERLLSISGQDRLPVNRKNQPYWEGTLGTQVWMASNTFPGFTDASAVIASRFIPMWLRESWLGREDTTLRAKLEAELPGILNHMVTALARLRRRGYFRVPESAKQVIEIMEDRASPIRAFGRECCEFSPEYAISCDTEAFLAYDGWCADHRHKLGSKSGFRKNLMEAFPTVTVTRPRDDDGKPQWVCQGMKLNARGLEFHAEAELKERAQSMGLWQRAAEKMA
jgi:putative DNA primase/helicase